MKNEFPGYFRALVPSAALSLYLSPAWKAGVGMSELYKAAAGISELYKTTGMSELHKAAAGISELYKATNGISELYRAAAGISDFYNENLAATYAEQPQKILGDLTTAKMDDATKSVPSQEEQIEKPKE